MRTVSLPLSSSTSPGAPGLMISSCMASLLSIVVVQLSWQYGYMETHPHSLYPDYEQQSSLDYHFQVKERNVYNVLAWSRDPNRQPNRTGGHCSTITMRIRIIAGE